MDSDEEGLELHSNDQIPTASAIGGVSQIPIRPPESTQDRKVRDTISSGKF